MTTSSPQRARRLNIVLATVFFLVGVVSAVNTVRLNDYIRHTNPRDARQEACQLATLQALRVWAVGRGQIEDANAQRDRELLPLLAQLERGEPVSPEMAAKLQNEVDHVKAVRSSVQKMLQSTPIPTCRLQLNGG